MPRSKNNIKRPAIDVCALEKGINDVLKDNVSVRSASKKYGISRTTLHRHLKEHCQRTNNMPNKDFIYSANNDTMKVFSKDQEIELVSYLKQAAKFHYGLTRKESLKLAYEYAKCKSLCIPVTWEENKLAGKTWLRGFRKRFPSFTFKKSKPACFSPATTFNQTNVDEFFFKLKSLLYEHKFPPNKIFNLDMTRDSTVHVLPKILCDKGTKQLGSVTSSERGVNITMITAVNATGNHVPPMIIFPRVNSDELMLLEEETGSMGETNHSGLSNEILFMQYLKRLIDQVNFTKDNPILLIVDKPDSHISIEAITLARDSGIIMLTLPPHTSHILQPLNRVISGPYKSFYNTALNEWMVQYPGKPISIYDLAGVIDIAYNKAFTTDHIQTAFRITGIYPFNENTFGQNELLTSCITDPTVEDSIILKNLALALTNPSQVIASLTMADLVPTTDNSGLPSVNKVSATSDLSPSLNKVLDITDTVPASLEVPGCSYWDEEQESKSKPVKNNLKLPNHSTKLNLL